MFVLWNVLRPPQAALACALLMAGFHFWLPIIQLVSPPFNYSGIPLFVGGFLFSLQARNWFKKTNTPLRPIEKPNQLQTAGPFGFSRNPMYLGMGIGLLGGAFLLGSLAAFAFPVVFFLIMNFGFVPFEERMLEKLFGKEYLAYKKKVRRWL